MDVYTTGKQQKSDNITVRMESWFPPYIRMPDRAKNFVPSGRGPQDEDKEEHSNKQKSKKDSESSKTGEKGASASIDYST